VITCGAPDEDDAELVFPLLDDAAVDAVLVEVTPAMPPAPPVLPEDDDAVLPAPLPLLAEVP
jgi:hypothetical protein